MTPMLGYGFQVKGRSVSEEVFCTSFLKPLFGEKNAIPILQQLKYMMFAFSESEYARKRLVRRTKDGLSYLTLNEYGRTVSFRCSNIDGICIANIIECK